MKDTLHFLITQLVEHPEEVRIEESTQEESIILTIHAHTDDLGKIIGKNGRIIRAIRDCIKIIATKRNQYVDIVIAEDQTSQPATQTQ